MPAVCQHALHACPSTSGCPPPRRPRPKFGEGRVSTAQQEPRHVPQQVEPSVVKVGDVAGGHERDGVPQPRGGYERTQPYHGASCAKGAAETAAVMSFVERGTDKGMYTSFESPRHSTAVITL